jgi:hypothetical protein
LRSASGPSLLRYALTVAPASRGDVLWLAYVPEGLQSWLSRFADSVDPTLKGKCPFRLIRLFTSPPADEVELFVARIAARRLAKTDDPALDHSGASRDVAALADAIDRGELHVRTIIIDVHHLATLGRQLRRSPQLAGPGAFPKQSTAALAETAAMRLASLLRRIADAGLNCLILTPLAGRPTGGAPAPRDADATLLAAIDRMVDQSGVVEEQTDGAGSAPFRTIAVKMDGADRALAAGSGDQDLAARFGVASSPTWPQCLDVLYPRADRMELAELRESPARWADATQDEFAELARRRGCIVTQATLEVDRREHWDARLERNGEARLVDVKARSRIRRSDTEPQDNWHWVELRGIVDEGWLFGGRADYIAFQTDDSFLLVSRGELAEHVKHHVDPADVVSDPRQAEYRVYHRRDLSEAGAGRATGTDRGLLTLIPTARLRHLAAEEWPRGKAGAADSSPGDGRGDPPQIPGSPKS